MSEWRPSMKPRCSRCPAKVVVLSITGAEPENERRCDIPVEVGRGLALPLTANSFDRVVEVSTSAISVAFVRIISEGSSTSFSGTVKDGLVGERRDEN